MIDRELHPGKILKISGSYWHACALHAGIKIDLFTAIGKDMLAAKEIARKINGDLKGVETLLNALSAMGFLKKANNTYQNTPTAETYLSKTSSDYIGYIILHHRDLVNAWANLDTAVLTGKPNKKHTTFAQPENRENFLMGMFNLAMQLAPQIVPHIDLSERQHLLDLGGGPGTYAIHFCLENPNLKATIYDLASTKPFALETVDKFSLSDRIDFISGNYLEDTISGHYDVAWLSHILHGESPENCRDILQKTAFALKPGGLILIHEFILNNQMDGPLFPALFSLNMLTGTEHGQSYSENQLMEMLAGIGAQDIKRIPLTTPNDSGVILATV
jgi:predicted O-methyltransferase YrrM